jgi:drug/metabolite transporter (DMT)-like permease
LGDLIGIIVSFTDASYFSMTDTLFKKIPSLLGVTIIMTLCLLMNIGYGSLIMPDYNLSFDPETGVFGFIFSDYLIYIIFVSGCVSGAFTFIGYVMVLKYYSPLVLCTAFLFEPLMS